MNRQQANKALLPLSPDGIYVTRGGHTASVESEQRLRDAERHLYALRESQHQFRTEIMSGALRVMAHSAPPVLLIQNPDQK